MSVEENKAVVRRELEEVWNKRNLAVLNEIVAENCEIFYAGQSTAARGPEGYKQYVTMALSAFPDFKVTIDDLVAEGDKVAIRYTISGTHKGNLLGFPATGKHMTCRGLQIMRLAAGKYVEFQDLADVITMYTQLGLIKSVT